MLGIHSCGVLSSCMWCTKQLLVCPCSYSGSAEMLSSSNPPSVLQWSGLSIGNDSLPIVRLSTEPLPTSKNFVVVMDILSVGVVS